MSCKGLKTQGISEQLDIPANTVYVLRNRVKDRLLNEMNNLRQFVVDENIYHSLKYTFYLKLEKD